MPAFNDQFNLLAAEFNKELGRTDGESITRFLHGRFEDDLSNWFYARVFRIFDGLQESEWSKQDQAMSEFWARNEISCLQAIETAIIAQDSNYVSEGKVGWLPIGAFTSTWVLRHRTRSNIDCRIIGRNRKNSE